MAIYRICPYCGDHLDQGEKCDCQEEEEQKRKMFEKLIMSEPNGQLVFKEAIA